MTFEGQHYLVQFLWGAIMFTFVPPFAFTVFVSLFARSGDVDEEKDASERRLEKHWKQSEVSISPFK